MLLKFSKILVGVFAIVLLLPSIGLAGLKLQQNYPAISGITGQSDSLNTLISQTPKNAPINSVSLIKYFFTLAGVILIGLATLAVIIAGVQYLSSAGKVQAQKVARTRLLRGFLGLAITIGAVVILNFFIPNLQVPQITHIYSVSNVVLISQTGLNTLNANANNITKEYLNQLSDQGLIKYFASQSGDLTQNFGQLTKYASPNISFEEFQPAYIGFFGSGAKNIQVKTFAGKNFLGASDTKKLPSANSVGGMGNIEIFYFDLPTYLATASNIDYFDIQSDPQKFKPATEATSNYPPLSISVEGISSGVYLYGGAQMPVPPSEQPDISGDVDTGESIKFIGGKGGQRYLQFDILDFSDPAFDFNNEAMQIEIKNNRQADIEAQDDLLVFLFQGKYFQGPFRVFFEKRSKAFPVAKLYYDPADTERGSVWFKDVQNIAIIGNNVTQENGYDVPSIFLNSVGNQGNKIDINKMDQQGKVFGVSSARVFHLAPIESNNCQAVALCNAEDLKGFCLVFTPRGTSIGKWMSFFLPMPWLMPTPLPERFDEHLKDVLLANPEQKNIFLQQRKTEKGVKDNTDFEDNIKSIGIKGNCVVALYDNSVKNFEECLTGTLDSCWDKKTPGAKSMVFSVGDMVSGVGERQMPYLNLKNYQIHSCVSLASALRLTPPHSCVSSIAVYPVK